jgi:integrase
MGHVRRTDNGRWEARYRSPGGQERAKRFATKREADAFLARTSADRQRGEWVDPAGGRVRLADWVRQWSTTEVSLRPSSKARDESYLRTHVLPVFGDFSLSAITNLAVRDWVADLKASRLAPATVQKAHQTLSKIMRSAVDAGLLVRNPCERVPLPRVERQEMRVLTPPEITSLAETINPRYSALVTFAAYSGLRLGEIAGLRRNRLDLTRHEVRVSEIAVEVRGELFRGPPKTRAGNRTVPLPGFVVEAMTDHVERYATPGPDGLVFPGAEGGTLRASQWRNRHWYPAVRQAGLAPLRPHDLRHTAVSLWIAAGATPNQIAAWAGHTSVSVVLDRYGHLFPGHEREVLDRLERFDRGGPRETGIDR